MSLALSLPERYVVDQTAAKKCRPRTPSGPTDMSDGVMTMTMTMRLRNGQALSVRNLALRTLVTGS